MVIEVKIKDLLAVIIIAILAYLPFYVTKDLKQNSLDKAAIEKTIEDYLAKDNVGAKNRAKTADVPKMPDSSEAIKRKKAELNDLNAGVVIANPKGKINMIEFTDSNCPFCVRNVNTMRKIAKENPDVRWIVRPVTSMGGTVSAQAIYAANKQNSQKARELHDAIYSFAGQKTKEAILDMAKKAGLDVKRLEKDMASEEINRLITNSVNIFSDIGGSGVPGIVIGENLIRGAFPEQEFLNHIENLR